MPTEPLKWPGDGREMVYNPKGYGAGPWACGAWLVPGYHRAGLSADGHSFGDGYTRLTHEGRTPTQVDVNALHARLCAQADALDAVTGRGTVAHRLPIPCPDCSHEELDYTHGMGVACDSCGAQWGMPTSEAPDHA